MRIVLDDNDPASIRKANRMFIHSVILFIIIIFTFFVLVIVSRIYMNYKLSIIACLCLVISFFILMYILLCVTRIIIVRKNSIEIISLLRGKNISFEEIEKITQESSTYFGPLELVPISPQYGDLEIILKNGTTVMLGWGIDRALLNIIYNAWQQYVISQRAEMGY